MKKIGLFILFICLSTMMFLSAQEADRDLTVKNFVIPSADSVAHPLPGPGPFVVTRTIDFASEGENCNTNDDLVVLWLPDDAVALYAVCGSPDGFNTTNAVSVTPKYWDAGSNAWSNVVSAQSISTQAVTSASTSVTAKKYAVKLGAVPTEGEYFISVFGYRFGE